jgi:hypothetical protein
VSYQLEREMHDRVDRYRREAELRRTIPHQGIRRSLAVVLRKLADRVEPRRQGRSAAGELLPTVLQGRNH